MQINKVPLEVSNFLKRLKTIDNPPKYLSYIGMLPDNPELVVAIIGTRRPTSYGRTVTEQISEALSYRGTVIVSGMALGVDSIAHNSCLNAGGQTIAVMASGVDNPYPKTNLHLAKRILENGGAILSEYENGHQPRPYDFLWRNRIVSGLADVVIVTEANLRSGTLSTVAHALEQGKDVYAVPGPITSPLSAGCNRLIAQGARPITDIDGLLNQLGLSGQTSLNLGDTPEEQKLIELIHSGISDGDELQQLSNFTPAQLSQALTMLEIKGIVTAIGGNKWRL